MEWSDKTRRILFNFAVSTVLMFYTMLISVVQTSTHAKRHQNPLKIWRCILDVIFERVASHCLQRWHFKSSKFCIICWWEYHLTLFSTQILLVFRILPFQWLALIKKRWYLRSVGVNDPLHEKEIFLLRPWRNFASVKQEFIECLDFTR